MVKCELKTILENKGNSVIPMVNIGKRLLCLKDKYIVASKWKKLLVYGANP